MSGLLTDADLNNMRSIIADMLPDTCNILSESIASDGEGGVTSTWGTVSANVACRLDDATTAVSRLIAAGGGQKAAHQYVLSLPHDAEIGAGNRVEVGSNTYTVINVNAGQSWILDTRAVLELI